MKRLRFQRRNRRCLVFSPLAWLKLQYLCHAGPTEVGAFAISAPGTPLYVTNLVTVQQVTTMVSVEFDDQAVADYFDQCVDKGLKPTQFARTWIHTHPGSSASPSGTDEETFRRVFGNTDWAVMAILSREGQTYARLQFPAGPGGSCRLRWRVDWESWPRELTNNVLTDFRDAWQQEYRQNVLPQTLHHFGIHPTHTQPELFLPVNQMSDLDTWDESFWTSLGDTVNETPIP